MQKRVLLLIFLFICKQVVLSQTNDSTVVQKHRVLNDRFIINSGLFVTSKSVFLDVGGDLPSNPIDFTETLGLNRRENTFALNFYWRFSKDKKWFMGIEYFGVKNSQNIVLEDEIKWSNTIYPVGVELDSGFGINLYRLFFGRVISSGNKHEFSGGLGLHTMNINTFVQAKAYLQESFYELDTERKKFDVLAPVPNIGLRYLYTPNLRLALVAQIDWFSLTVGDYSGTLWNVAPEVSFQVFNNIGIGLGYRYFKANFKMNRKLWHGSADLLYQGPLLTLNGSF